MPLDSAKMIDQMASSRLGPAPDAGAGPGAPASPEQAAAAAAPPPPQAAPQAAPEPKDKDTAQDKATEAGAPADASTKMGADPVIYDIDFGEGKKRKMTPEQIKGISERYSALNYQHAQMKPVIDLVENLLKSNPDAKPEHVAQFMEQALRATQKNPQMGDPNADAPGRENKESPPDVDPLAKWEEENAATLPPGYREMMTGNQSIQQQMAQMQQMLQQVLAGASGVADAARAGNEDARSERINAIRQSIANNIDRAQAQLQLPDTEAENFMAFAAERGYSLEDMVDPRLTTQVMQDFKNSLNSPEFERLMEINKRRQAWTGAPMPSAPTGPAGQVPGEGTGNKMFDDLTRSVMTRRYPGQA